MAAELQPPEALMTAGPTAATATTTTATTTTALEETTAVLSTDNPGQALAPKRQRRPSVRLGEIGDQPATLSYESHVRRNKQHPLRLPKEPSSKSVKARSLTNLVNGGDYHDIQEPPEDRNQNGDGNLEFANRKKAKRATKRVRSNWAMRIEDGAVAEGDSREDGNQNEGFRDFDPDSDSQQKDHSPVHSVDNVELDLWHGFRMQGRARVSQSRVNDAVELDNFPESDSRDRKCVTSEGVRSWLFELGLSRYAPVFEIHEVDDDVLPMLTLEDLKDMGINAIGSRRKMYSAIQKLRKGFS